LVAGNAEQLLLDALLQRCRERQLLRARGRQRTDSTHVLGAIRALNRLECVGETLRHALNSLAIVAPEWLRRQSQPEWVERYGTRVAAARLPASKEAQAAYAHTVGGASITYCWWMALLGIQLDGHRHGNLRIAAALVGRVATDRKISLKL